MSILVIDFWGVSEDWESFLLDFSRDLKLVKKDGSGTGLPAVIFICSSHEGILLGESKARWWPFTAVDSKISQMRLGRFPADSLKTLQDRCEVLKPIWKKWKSAKSDGEVFRREVQMKMKQSEHRTKPGRAYSVFATEEKPPFSRRAPCPKCFGLYDWGYHNVDDLPDRNIEFFAAGNCAEDDVHLRLGEGHRSLLNKNKDQSAY